MNYQHFVENLESRDLFYKKIVEFKLGIGKGAEMFDCLIGMTHNLRTDFDELRPIDDMIATLGGMRCTEVGKNNQEIIDLSMQFVLRCSFE